MGKKLYHGACYYPELWDEDTIQQDIDRMREVGINVVRIGEFAWSVIEPEEGNIDVSFFKEMIKRMYDNGIETIMCTPTPTPPIWLSHGRPERMHINEKREVMGHGSRQHACTNNPYFRKRAAIITTSIAKELGHLPGLIGWRLDNEFKCHVAECMCETCLSLWHEWLRNRYGVIERLNEAWGTDVWSETYQTFEQVPLTGSGPFLHHASLRTMYQLFSMEMIAQFADEQAKIIRSYSDAPITHNGSVMFSTDNERMFQNLDFASYDTYASQDNASAFLLNCDIWRHFKKTARFGFWKQVRRMRPLSKAVPCRTPMGIYKLKPCLLTPWGARDFATGCGASGVPAARFHTVPSLVHGESRRSVIKTFWRLSGQERKSNRSFFLLCPCRLMLR